jgi:translocation and assembly module TamB
MAATFADRVAQLKGTVRSAAVEIDADGMVNLGEGVFKDLKLDIGLLRPSIIGSNVSGD